MSARILVVDDIEANVRLLEAKLSPAPLVLGHSAHRAALAIFSVNSVAAVSPIGTVPAISTSEAANANTVLAVHPILAGGSVFTWWSGFARECGELRAQVSHGLCEQGEDAAIIAVHRQPPRRAGPGCAPAAPGSGPPSGQPGAVRVVVPGPSLQPRVRAGRRSRLRCA